MTNSSLSRLPEIPLAKMRPSAFWLPVLQTYPVKSVETKRLCGMLARMSSTKFFARLARAFLDLPGAVCHDHKFDPIEQSDYYSMQAIFAGLQYGDRRKRGSENDDWSARVPAAKKKRDTIKVELESLRLKHGLREPLDIVHKETFDPVWGRSVRMRIATTEFGDAASLYEFEVWSSEDDDSDRTNVALASNGSRISASSFALQNQSRHFDNLVDGTVDKRQAYPWIANETGPAWLRIDFSNATAIDQIVWHQGCNNRSLPAEYVIEALTPYSEEWLEIAHTRNRLPRASDPRKAEDIDLPSLNLDAKKTIVGKVRALGKRREI